MPDDRRRLYAALGMLLQYPEAGFARLLPQVRALADATPAAEGLSPFLDWLAQTPLLEAQGHYVELFDRRRRACLYLSYYLNGDTRRRGMAIVRFKELYAEHGWQAGDAELPDFLPTVLQFTAVSDRSVGEQVLAGHRAGLEVLHGALLDARSPYRHLTAVLLDLVPEATETDHELAMRLIEQGPPAELVGLEPFALAQEVGAR